MNAIEVLKAMSESEDLADEVLDFLNEGMHEEWDISLPDGLMEGFGGEELQIAARSAFCRAEFFQRGAGNEG